MRSVSAFTQLPRDTGPPCQFVGRAAELQLLVQHARRHRPEGPGIAVLSAAAGMGKTAFLDRLAERLAEQFVLAVAPGPDGSQRPFWLANQLITTMHDRGMADLVPLCRHGDPPHTAGQRLLTALTALASGPAGRAVTVIVDDVQHADVESSLALGYAARRMYGQPVLLVLAVRTQEDGAPDPNVRRIMPARGDELHVRLGGLSVVEVQTLGHLLGVIPLRRVDARRIRGHCEGNPRFVTRLLEEIRRDPHARLRRPLPSFSSTISEQIQGLPEASRALLCALAVLNERCPLSTVATVAEVARPLQALEPLLAAGLVRWWPAEPTTPVCIRTPLQRETAYELTPPQLRRALHERAARRVPFDRALEHRTLAAHGRTDQQLSDELTATAWRWTAEGNLARAARYLLWAAELGRPGGDSDRRLLFGISLLQRDHQYEAAAVLQDRARSCQPSALRSCVMGRFAMIDGELTEARALLEAAITDIEHESTVRFGPVAAIGYTWLAQLYGWLGESALARDAAWRCLEVSPFGPRFDRGAQMTYLSMCLRLEGPQATQRQLAALVTLPAVANEVDPSDSLLLMLRGHLRLLCGEPAEAVADIDAALTSARRAGITDAHEWAHLWMTTAHAVLGSWDRAAEHAGTALEIVMADGRPHLPIMLALTAYVAANRGELAVAAERAGAATDLADHAGMAAERMMAALATATLAQAKDDPLAVIDAMRPFTGAATGVLRVYRWLWLPGYTDALLELGHLDKAQAALRAMAADIADGYTVLTVPYRYLHARIMEATGDLVRARATYDSAVNAAAALGHPQWRSRAAAAGRRLALLSSSVSPAAERTHLLTERERAIASLIADGMSNKAVSGYLGITEKTIEGHLTRVYRKLAVKSRGELQAAIHGALRKGGPATVLLLGPCARSGSQPRQNRYGNSRYREPAGGAG